MSVHVLELVVLTKLLSVALIASLGGLCGCARGLPPRSSELPVTAAAPEQMPIAQSAAAAPRSLRRRALLVAINQYKYNYPRLAGCINDAENLRDVLTQRFDFPSEDVLLLRDGEATLDGIRAAFEQHLIARADADTEVVFYFSGHGSSVNDDDGDEADCLDETLVTHDSGRQEGAPNRDLRDDELHTLLARLHLRTKRITVILDSCHSGTGARALGVRSLPRDARTAPICGAAATVDAEARSQTLPYTLITAARPNELAYERNIDGVTRGALTWHLARALRQAPQGATYRDVMEQVQSEVNGQFPSQHPQVEGLDQDRLLFGASQRRPPRHTRVSQLDTRLVLEAGRLHGVTEGSVYAVYRAGEQTFDAGQELLRAEVSRLDDFVSELRPLSGSADALGGTTRALEIEHVDRAAPLRVFFEAKHMPSIARSRLLLSKHHDLAEVATDADADMVVRAVSAREVELVTARGEPLSHGLRVDAAWGEQLSSAVHGWSRWRALHQLANVAHAPDLELTLPRSRGGIFDADAVATAVRAGDGVTLTVANRTDQPWYFTIFLLSQNGSITQLYPPAGAAEQLTAHGSWTQSFKACRPEGWDGSLRDTVKVVFTRTPAALQDWQQPALIRDAEAASVREARPPGQRGLSMEAEPWDWFVRQKMIEVQPQQGAAPCS